jgi:hypothetical protein
VDVKKRIQRLRIQYKASRMYCCRMDVCVWLALQKYEAVVVRFVSQPYVLASCVSWSIYLKQRNNGLSVDVRDRGIRRIRGLLVSGGYGVWYGSSLCSLIGLLQLD